MIRNRILMGVFAGLVVCAAVAATERVANKYKTHKLAINSVLVSCEDERVPVVKRLDGPFVVITCETAAR